MASQNSIADPGVSRSILAVDGESDSETRRIHTRTRGSVNTLPVEMVGPDGTPIAPGFAIPDYDYIELSNYSGTNPQTITYKTGGASGTTVATIALTYDGSGNLLTVTLTLP